MITQPAEVSVLAKEQAIFLLTRVTPADLLFQRLGFSRPTELRVLGSSTPLLLFAPAAESLLQFWGEPRHTQWLRRLAELGIDELELDGKKLRARRAPYRGTPQESSLAFVEEVTRLLEDIVRELPLAGDAAETRRGLAFLEARRRAVGPGNLLWGLFSGTFLCLAAVARFCYPPVVPRDGLGVAILSGLLGAAIGALLLRYLWRPALPAKDLVVMAVSRVTTLAILFASASLFCNGLLDRSREEEHVLPILRKWHADGAGGHSDYFLTVKSWRDPQRNVEVQVTKSDYDEVSPDHQIDLRTRPGLFATEWIARYFLVNGGSTTCLEDCVAAAYERAKVERILFSPGGSRLPSHEKRFLVDFFQLLDLAIANRIWASAYLRGEDPPYTRPMPYGSLVGKLTRLKAPPRLKKVQKLVTEALWAHAAFMAKWQRAVDDQRGGTVDPESARAPASTDPVLESASEKLQEAYELLVFLYADEEARNKQAFRSYFAALDFLLKPPPPAPLTVSEPPEDAPLSTPLKKIPLPGNVGKGPTD